MFKKNEAEKQPIFCKTPTNRQIPVAATETCRAGSRPSNKLPTALLPPPSLLKNSHQGNHSLTMALKTRRHAELVLQKFLSFVLH